MIVNPDGSVTVSVTPGYALMPMDYLQQSNLANLERNYRLQQLQLQQQQALQQRQTQQQKQPPTQYDPWAEDADESTLPPSVFAPQNMPPLNGAMGHGVPPAQPQAASEGSSWLPGVETFLEGLGAVGLAELLRRALSTKVLSATPVEEALPGGASRALPAGAKALPPGNTLPPGSSSETPEKPIALPAASSESDLQGPRIKNAPTVNPSPFNPQTLYDAINQTSLREQLKPFMEEPDYVRWAREAEQYFGKQEPPALLPPEERAAIRENFNNVLNEERYKSWLREEVQKYLKREARQNYQKVLGEERAKTQAKKREQNNTIKNARRTYEEAMADIKAGNKIPVKQTTAEPATNTATMDEYNKLVESNKSLQRSINMGKVNRGDPIETVAYGVWRANIAREQAMARQLGIKPSVNTTGRVPNVARGLVNPLSVISFGLNTVANSQELNPNDDTLTNLINLLSSFAGVSTAPPKPGVPYYDLRTGSVIGEVN